MLLKYDTLNIPYTAPPNKSRKDKNTEKLCKTEDDRYKQTQNVTQTEKKIPTQKNRKNVIYKHYHKTALLKTSIIMKSILKFISIEAGAN